MFLIFWTPPVPLQKEYFMASITARCTTGLLKSQTSCICTCIRCQVETVAMAISFAWHKRHLRSEGWHLARFIQGKQARTDFLTAGYTPEKLSGQSYSNIHISHQGINHICMIYQVYFKRWMARQTHSRKLILQPPTTTWAKLKCSP